MKKTIFFLALFVQTLLLSIAPMKLSAQAGSLDPSFDPGTGPNDVVNSLAIQGDGKIIIVGGLAFTEYNGTARNRIARILADGSLDTSFDPGSGVDLVLNDVAIQSDGKIIITGTFNTYNYISRIRIARIHADGSPDMDFNPGTGADNTISSIAIQSDGKIIIVGNFTNYNSLSINRIVRINTDGSPDMDFNPGTGANSSIRSVAIQSDGKIIIGGIFTNYNGSSINRIARINTDGSLDTEFNPGTGTNNSMSSIAIQDDGKILLMGGFFTSYNGTARKGIVRINTDGSLDTEFNPGTGASSVQSGAIQDDGKIIIGGNFSSYNGTAINGIARINVDGSLDTGFNPGTGTSGISSVAIQDDGKIIIGGSFLSYNGTARIRVARLFGDCSDEICNGSDDDCDSLTDDDDPSVMGQFSWYVDEDNDGYGNAAISTIACNQPTGYVINSDDCDDTNMNIHPNNWELCNGIDDDCDDVIDEPYVAYNNPSVEITADHSEITCATTSVIFTATTSGIILPEDPCPDCGGIQALDGSNIFYRYATVYDWDCCLFGPGIYEDPPYLVDGHIKVEYDCYGNGIIIESTGSYVSFLPVGAIYNESFGTSAYPNYKSLVTNPACCNADGSMIYVELTEERVFCQFPDPTTFSYQWTVNGMNAGTDNPYTTNSFVENDIVTCLVTVHSSCGDESFLSNQIEIIINNQSTWYIDADNDSFGNASSSILACNQPSGYVSNNEDCNDADTMINPMATEICDAIDNDCDNLVDDADPNIVGQVSWYQDADGDGFGNPDNVITVCFQPVNYTGTGTDCDDTNAGNNPDATEVLDGEDNDCDGLIDEGLSAISADAGDCVVVYNGYAPAECAVLTVNVQGGVLPYTYEWSNGANTATTTVCPGETTIYQVIVTDDNGNSAQDVVTVQVVDISCGNNKVTMCHIPPGNPENVQTICISVNAVATHLEQHGDYLGVCNALDPCEGENQSLVTLPVETHLFEENHDHFNLVSSDNPSEYKGPVRNINSGTNEILVFPNPTNGMITLRIPVLSGEGVIRVLDLTGQELEYQRIVGDQQVILDLLKQSSGIYLIDVRSANGHYQKKIVKL